MILASLHISGRCVKMMLFNESMIGGFYLFVRFRHLSHMLSHYVQLHARLCGSMRALLHAYLVGSIFFFAGASICMHCLYVRSDTTMDPMCVRAANALMSPFA